MPRDLAQLAIEANKHHEEAEAAKCVWLEQALVIGEALLEAQQQLPAGGWSPWVNEHLTFSVQHAAMYMRVAFHAETIRAKGAESKLQVQAAMYELPARPRQTKCTPEMRSHIKGLRTKGESWVAISKETGIGYHTLRAWFDPGYRDRVRQRNRQSRLRSIEGQRALARQEQTRMVKRAGGSASTAYGMIRRVLQILDRAVVEAEDRDVAAALREAMGYSHKAEDAIVAAIKSATQTRQAG